MCTLWYNTSQDPSPWERKEVTPMAKKPAKKTAKKGKKASKKKAKKR